MRNRPPISIAASCILWDRRLVNHCSQASGPTGTTERLWRTALNTALATRSGGQPKRR